MVRKIVAAGPAHATFTLSAAFMLPRFVDELRQLTTSSRTPMSGCYVVSTAGSGRPGRCRRSRPAAFPQVQASGVVSRPSVQSSSLEASCVGETGRPASPVDTAVSYAGPTRRPHRSRLPPVRPTANCSGFEAHLDLVDQRPRRRPSNGGVGETREAGVVVQEDGGYRPRHSPAPAGVSAREFRGHLIPKALHEGPNCHLE